MWKYETIYYFFTFIIIFLFFESILYYVQYMGNRRVQEAISATLIFTLGGANQNQTDIRTAN